MRSVLFPRLLPAAVALALVFLVLFALQTYRESTEALALQHNLQHLRLIKTVASSLESRLINMQAAFNHYAGLIAPPFGPGSNAASACDEVADRFSTIVSNALILGSGNNQETWPESESRLGLTTASTAQLKLAASGSDPNILFLSSTRGEHLLVFLTPLRRASGSFCVVVPLERLLDTYHLNDAHIDEDYVWILDHDGSLIYHRHHPEMTGRNVFAEDATCRGCHESFELEKRMLRGAPGFGKNEVPKGTGKIVAYSTLTVANLRWTIAISEALDKTTALLQRHTKAYTLFAALLSILILGATFYVSHSYQLRRRAEQEALHLREERELQQQVERKHRQLLEAERFATVGRMAAQVAHEIKNPLSSISLNAELLGDHLQAEGERSSPESQQLIGSILSEIDLLTITIDEYLQFARFPKLQKEEMSIAELFGSLQQLLAEESASRDIAFRCAAHPGLPRISADPRLIRQALLNLIRNAFDAIGSKGWVRVEAARAEGEIRLEVSDSGPGIAAACVPMLFEPFFTTKPKGTGLGLSLARHIVSEHGGTIGFEPTAEAPCRFVIALPLENPDSRRGKA